VTDTVAALLARKTRCPQCDHPAVLTDHHDEAVPFADETRHSVYAVCNNGHGWTLSWTT
jgi:hypothetical protein